MRRCPKSARRVFAAIEAAIGDGSSASVSYVSFRLDRPHWSVTVLTFITLLRHLDE
jgi:hypothetical protein